jgi:inhibitor of KinA
LPSGDVFTRLLRAGDAAWLIELEERIDPGVNAGAIRIARAIEQSGIPATDLVVGYRTVMVYFDPFDPRSDGIEARLRAAVAATAEGGIDEGPLKEVPACYGGEFGPDLDHVARFGRCSAQDVIAMHLAREYRVYVVGFVPGWAYLAAVDERIAAPRRSSPRVKVPAGSLGIAAIQTGIYPAETPGGWNLIGRCPIKPYDPNRAVPFLFEPGDRVRFRRISEAEYRASSQWEDG